LFDNCKLHQVTSLFDLILHLPSWNLMFLSYERDSLWSFSPLQAVVEILDSSHIRKKDKFFLPKSYPVRIADKSMHEHHLPSKQLARYFEPSYGSRKSINFINVIEANILRFG